MTLSLLALWFLILERLGMGGETPAVTVSQVRQIFTGLLRSPAPSPRMDGAGRHASPGEEGDGTDLQVSQEERPIAAAPSDPRDELNSGDTA